MGAENLVRAGVEVGAESFVRRSVTWVGRRPDGVPFDETSPTNPDPTTRSAVGVETIVSTGADGHGFDTDGAGLMVVNRVNGLAGIVVVAHAVAASGHGSVHLLVPVPPAPWQRTFVTRFAAFGPAFAIAFVLVDRTTFGGTLLAVSMGSSFCFGRLHHFALSTPDSIASVTGRWSALFTSSAIPVAVTEPTGGIAGLRLVLDPDVPHRAAVQDGRFRCARSRIEPRRGDRG